MTRQGAFHASSLEDIAKYFDVRAKQAHEDENDPVSTKKARTAAAIRRMTWERAASFVREEVIFTPDYKQKDK
jgi:hypothetical protein